MRGRGSLRAHRDGAQERTHVVTPRTGKKPHFGPRGWAPGPSSGPRVSFPPCGAFLVHAPQSPVKHCHPQRAQPADPGGAHSPETPKAREPNVRAGPGGSGCRGGHAAPGRTWTTPGDAHTLLRSRPAGIEIRRPPARREPGSLPRPGSCWESVCGELRSLLCNLHPAPAAPRLPGRKRAPPGPTLTSHPTRGWFPRSDNTQQPQDGRVRTAHYLFLLKPSRSPTPAAPPLRASPLARSFPRRAAPPPQRWQPYLQHHFVLLLRFLDHAHITSHGAGRREEAEGGNRKTPFTGPGAGPRVPGRGPGPYPGAGGGPPSGGGGHAPEVGAAARPSG